MLESYYNKLINVLKVQGENLFSHFVSTRIVTLSDYNDCSEKFHKLPRQKATWLLQKISGHLAAGTSKSFHIMLSLMQEHGDIACIDLTSKIEAELSKLRNPPLCKYLNCYELYCITVLCLFSNHRL